MKNTLASRTAVGKSSQSDPDDPAGDPHFLPRSLWNFIFVSDGLKLHMCRVFLYLWFPFREPLQPSAYTLGDTYKDREYRKRRDLTVCLTSLSSPQIQDF